jgi:hypothetical protein
MDLREFLRLFWKERVLFSGTVAVFVATGFVVQLLQPIRFAAEITMNVARSGVRTTTEYAYDDFYRLQADERFADTVVRWLESPRIVSDILHTAKRDDEMISLMPTGFRHRLFAFGSYREMKKRQRRFLGHSLKCSIGRRHRSIGIVWKQAGSHLSGRRPLSLTRASGRIGLLG